MEANLGRSISEMSLAEVEAEYREIVAKLPTRAPIYLPTDALSPTEKLVGIRRVRDIYQKRLDSLYRPKLRALREQYNGTNRCFVIGNGPSLNKTDLACLRNEITFAVNGFFLKSDDLGWTPTFYVVEDHLVAEDRRQWINAYKGPTKLFPAYLGYCIDEADDTIFFNHRPRKSYPTGFDFSTDASEITYTGCTVTFTTMQMAHYFGFREIYLVGVDASYVIPTDAQAQEAYGVGVLDMKSDDPNHFDPNYFGKGFRWHDPQVDKMVEAYQEARKITDKIGRPIYNATVGGKLEVFERRSFSAVCPTARSPQDVESQNEIQRLAKEAKEKQAREAAADSGDVRTFPRILIFDIRRFADGTATGEIKANLFAAWPAERIIQVYSIKPGVLGAAIYSATGYKGEPLQGETVIAAAIESFAPDVILYRPVMDDPALHELAMLTIRQRGLPLVTWIMDDWPARFAVENPAAFEPMERDLRWLLANSTKRLSICDSMSRAFSTRYGVTFEAFANAVAPEDWPAPVTRPPTMVRLRYSGGLAPNMTLSSVLRVAEAVERLALAGYALTFEINTQKHWLPIAQSRFAEFHHTSLSATPLDPADYRSWLTTANVLLICYNFDEETRRYVRHSMANKMPECLASGAALLVHGPLETATVDYLASLECVVSVTEPDEEKLERAILSLLSPERRFQLGTAGQRHVFEKHNAHQIREDLAQLFRDAVNQGRSISSNESGVAAAARTVDANHTVEDLTDRPSMQGGVNSNPLTHPSPESENQIPTLLRVNNKKQLVYYPPIKRQRDLNEVLARAAWYFRPFRSVIEKIVLFTDIPLPDNLLLAHGFDPLIEDCYSEMLLLFKVLPTHQAEQVVASSEPSTANILLLTWKTSSDEEPFPRSVQKGIRALTRTQRHYALDPAQDHFEAASYLKLSQEHFVDWRSARADSVSRLEKFRAEHVRGKRAYVFGTGPSLQDVRSYDFSDGVCFVVNSMVKNVELLASLKPAALVAADPVFHSGCSRYAGRFRQNLLNALVAHPRMYFFVPERDYMIYLQFLPRDIHERIIAIPYLEKKPFNIDLTADFYVHTTSNVFTLMLLPLAATFFDQIAVAGCDGRAPEESEWYWRHDDASQFAIVNTARKIHPAFFEVDFDRYYKTHCETVALAAGVIETAGKEMWSLTPSYIPALHDRFHPQAIAPLPQGAVSVSAAPAIVQGEQVHEIAVLSASNSAGESIHDLRTMLNAELQNERQARAVEIEMLKVGFEASLSSFRRAIEKENAVQFEHHRGLTAQLDTLAASIDSVAAQSEERSEKIRSLTDQFYKTQVELKSAISDVHSALEDRNSPQLMEAASRIDELERVSLEAMSEVVARREDAVALEQRLQAKLEQAVANWQTSESETLNALRNYEQTSLSLDARVGDITRALQHLHEKVGASPNSERATDVKLLQLEQQIQSMVERLNEVTAQTELSAESLGNSSRVDIDEMLRLISDLEMQIRKEMQALQQAGDLRDQAAHERDSGVSSTLRDLTGQVSEMFAVADKLQERLADVRGEIGIMHQRYGGLGEQGEMLGAANQELGKRLATEVLRTDSLSQAVQSIRESVAGVVDAASRTEAIMGDGRALGPALNYGAFQPFNRRLTAEHIDVLENIWSKRLSVPVSSRSLSYMAHRTCQLESQMLGRLAAPIEDAMIRMLVAKAVKCDDVQILEIGTLFGVGAAILYDAVSSSNRKARLTVIDPLEGYYSKGALDSVTQQAVDERTFWANVDTAHIPRENVSLIQQYSTEPTAVRAAESRRYDLLIIDGDHSFAGVASDFLQYGKLMKVGGYVIFDDYGKSDWPDVQKFVDTVVPTFSWCVPVGTEWSSAVFRVIAHPDPEADVNLHSKAR